ncbi:alpha/beta fold hydrolase [Streptomyces flavidovirens]|uniref:alpha/beta fold hydrolase n=1 Tax=Streptomyces flavidovirens TaxID=67298 RepID=UPI003414DB12
MKGCTAERGKIVEERWINVDGVSTRYLETGTGKPVLLLPGEGSVAEQWHPVLEGLAHSHRAIAVDLPGYGYTDPLYGSNSPAQLASFVWRFAQEIGVESAAVVGHSLGGSVAVYMALQRPGKLSSLTLVSSAGMGRAISPAMVVHAVTPVGDLTKWLVPVIPFGPELLVKTIAALGARRPWRIPRPWWSSQLKAVRSPEALSGTLRSIRSSVGLLGQKNPLVGRLPELSIPVLVVWGIQDLVVPFWQGINARRNLRRGELKLFPCAGHLMPLEAADQFLAVLRPFLDRAGGGAPEEERWT